MYSRERWHDCSQRRTECVIPGCQPKCRYSLPEKVTRETSNCCICGRQSTETMVSPQCARIAEYRDRRFAIIDSAYAELDRLMPIKGHRAASAAYNKIAAEFYEQPCPFYEAQA